MKENKEKKIFVKLTEDQKKEQKKKEVSEIDAEKERWKKANFDEMIVDLFPQIINININNI